MEVIVELILHLVLEVVSEGAFEGFGRAVRRRWVRLAISCAVGFGAGLVWALNVSHDRRPLLISVVVVAQLAVAGIVVLRGGSARRNRWFVNLAAIGIAVVAARWLGWAIERDRLDALR